MEIISDKSENSNFLLPKLKILTQVSKWDNYECVKKNATFPSGIFPVTFIRGYLESSKDSIDLYNYQEINGIDFFIALIELHNKLSVKFSIMTWYNDIEKGLSDKDIDLILNFCRSYGLPFWATSPYGIVNICTNYYDDESTDDPARKNLLRGIVPLASENFFPVAPFIMGLDKFYTDFLLLVGLNHWQEDINIMPLIKGQEKHIDVLLSIKYRGFFTASLAPFTTYWDSSNMRLALNCENIMHLATYYICIMYQQKVFSFGYIRKCKKCGRLFVTAQSRQQFCNSPCTRQAYYMANKRLAKTIEKTD